MRFPLAPVEVELARLTNVAVGLVAGLNAVDWLIGQVVNPDAPGYELSHGLV
jgi:hypothetical protein